MKEQKISPLVSSYVIDGVPQELTPAGILDSVSEFPSSHQSAIAGRIVDETPECGASETLMDPEEIDKYLSAVLRHKRVFPFVFADSYTRFRIECALLDSLWKMGSFRIGDLGLEACWNWKIGPLGNAAAFYESVRAAGDMLDQLGVCLKSYSATESKSQCEVTFTAGLRSSAEDESIVERPYTTQSPKIGVASLPSTLLPNYESWIVYIPFDTSSYRLGGSILSQALKTRLPVAPAVDDPDYFLDCFEVVR